MNDSRQPLGWAEGAGSWPWRTWTDFARMSAEEKTATTIIVPVTGFADWGLGHPLDAEELVLAAVVGGAVTRAPAGFNPIVIPPLRFVLGSDPACAFAVDAAAAHAFLREVAQSIQVTGFRRLILFNSSPWNEELCAAASRDLRIELGLQIFRINLGMIGLDFHPTRSTSRREVQTLLTALTGAAPEPTARGGGGPEYWCDERIHPLAGPALDVPSAAAAADRILEAAVARVAGLFGEIAAHPALPRDGQLLVMTPP